MLFKSLLPSLLAAATVKAIPAPSLDDGHGELVLVKRDAILDARDLELAEMHNVNLTEMYKHSEIKRADGDDIHIWVARSFVDEEQDLAKRQQQHVRLGHGADFESGRLSDRCGLHSRDKKTNSGSPFKGGVDAMFRWADARSGGFKVDKGSDWQPLVVAGSNSGANAVHRVQAVDAGLFYVGIKDVRNDADWTRNHCETYNGRTRCSSTGRESCDVGPQPGSRRIRYQVVKTNEQA